jgi:hypothetical protein
MPIPDARVNARARGGLYDPADMDKSWRNCGKDKDGGSSLTIIRRGPFIGHFLRMRSFLIFLRNGR